MPPPTLNSEEPVMTSRLWRGGWRNWDWVKRSTSAKQLPMSFVRRQCACYRIVSAMRACPSFAKRRGTQGATHKR